MEGIIEWNLVFVIVYEIQSMPSGFRVQSFLNVSFAHAARPIRLLGYTFHRKKRNLRRL